MSSRQHTYALALSGVMLAVTLILNYIASFLDIFRIDVVFYLLSGALVYFTSRRVGIGMGTAFYAAAAILSFAIVPDKICVMLFIGIFGPCAVIQAAFARTEKKGRIGRAVAAVLSIIIFIILFYVFAFVVAYGGGFLADMDLPLAGTDAGIAIAIGFGAFSAVIANIVNRNLTTLIERRLGETGQTQAPGPGAAHHAKHATKRERANEAARHIDLPKLYHEEEEEDDAENESNSRFEDD
jgi:uncharacterized membrane protein (DUF485 family)